jgi:peptidoglycan/LPS O-acetylase OafA/YrhL
LLGSENNYNNNGFKTMFTKSSKEISPNFSLYLDLLRFMAAIAVFMDHISSNPFTKDFFYKPISSFGAMAVIVFFILSGYVIAYVTSTRENSLSLYATARMARMYSVVIVALILTLLFDNVGMILNADLYSIKKVMWEPQSLQGYLAAIFFVNEFQIFQFKGITAGTNAPYWSLSFEVAYYVIAGLFIFTRRWIALPIIAIILFCGGRTITALFPIWCLGYLLFFIEIKRPNYKLLYVGLVVSALLLAITPAILAKLPSNNFGLYFPWGRGPFNRNLIGDYLSAMLFAIHLLCAKQILSHLRVSIGKRIESAVRWLGSLTFPLYLIHFPAIAFFAAISPWQKGGAMNAIFIGLLTILVVLLTLPLTEVLKVKMKKQISNAFARIGDGAIWRNIARNGAIWRG